MIVAPCSMRSLGEIANGITSNLLTRAADVALKERRRLVLLARETPLHAIHLRNMLRLAEMGAIIAPPVPAFYNKPKTLDDMIDHTVGRVLDLFDLDTGKVRSAGAGYLQPTAPEPTTRAISSPASIREGPLHQGRHGGAVLGVGHDAETHGVDAEIADRRAQALLDRPLAVGGRRVQAGELDLLGMLGRELGIGHAAAHGVDGFGQRVRPCRSFSSRRTSRSGRTISACQASLALRMARSRSARQRRPARGAQPAAEQQDVHIAAAPLLQVEAGLGHALAGIELQREIPERMGQKIRHLWSLPFGRAKGYTAEARGG